MKPKEILAKIDQDIREYSSTYDEELLLDIEKEYSELFDLISTYFYLTNNPYHEYFAALEKRPDYTMTEGCLIQIFESGYSILYFHPFILVNLSLENLLFLLLLQMEYVNSPLPLLQGKSEYKNVTKLKDGILKQLFEQNREWNQHLLEKDENQNGSTIEDDKNKDGQGFSSSRNSNSEETKTANEEEESIEETSLENSAQKKDGYFEGEFSKVPDLAKSEGNLASRAFYQAVRMEKKEISIDEQAKSYFSLDSLKDIPQEEQRDVMMRFRQMMSSPQSGRERGDKSGDGSAQITLRKEKKIYWEKILRNVVGGMPYEKRHTHMRLNRRQPLRSDLSGTLSDRKASLVCAVDTSGSMDKNQIGKAMSQILKLKQSLGFDMTLIQCDSTIHDIKKIRSNKDIPAFASGRGGTAFTPVIKYLNEHKEYRNSVLIYFTDGYGEKNIPKPMVKKVLWIIIDDKVHISLKDPYGMVLPVSPDIKYEKQ